MAVVFDNVGVSFVYGSSPVTWTHTPVGTPTAVAVCFQFVSYFGAVTAVTYGGQTMSLFSSVVEPAIGQETTYIYGLASPPSGAQTVSVTTTSGGLTFVAGASITVTGSDTTTCFRAGSNATGAATEASGAVGITVSAQNGDLIVDICGNGNGNETQVPDAGQTSIYGPVTAGGVRVNGSYQAAVSTSTSDSWTWTTGASARQIVLLAAAFQVAAGGGPAPPPTYVTQGIVVFP